MQRAEHWTFLLLIVGWIASVALNCTLHGLTSALPLLAVLVLTNSLRRYSPVLARVHVKPAATARKRMAAR